MATTRQTLKQYFRQYATPTQAQFAELIDAFVHKDEDSLTQSKIDGLVAALEGKASTSQVNTMVASKVTEIVTDPQFAAAPTAHSHVAADVEGLSAFITRVTNFLDSADVSDTTINRWKEIETFLTGITDQQTLTGLLQQFQAEIITKTSELQIEFFDSVSVPVEGIVGWREFPRWSAGTQNTFPQKGTPYMYLGGTNEHFTHGLFYECTDDENGNARYSDADFCILDLVPGRWNGSSDFTFPLPLEKFPFDFESFCNGFRSYKSYSGHPYFFALLQDNERNVSFDSDQAAWSSASTVTNPQFVRTYEHEFAVFRNADGDRLVITGADVIRAFINSAQYLRDDSTYWKNILKRIAVVSSQFCFIPNGGDPTVFGLQSILDYIDVCTNPDSYNYSITEHPAVWTPIVTSPAVS